MFPVHLNLPHQARQRLSLLSQYCPMSPSIPTIATQWERLLQTLQESKKIEAPMAKTLRCMGVCVALQEDGCNTSGKRPLGLRPSKKVLKKRMNYFRVNRTQSVKIKLNPIAVCWSEHRPRAAPIAVLGTRHGRADSSTNPLWTAHET